MSRTFSGRDVIKALRRIGLRRVKMKSDDIIKMLHEIRVKHYEETKNLTTGELILKIRKEADVVEQKLLNLKKKNRKIYRGLRSKI